MKGMRQRKPMLPFLVALLKKGTQIALKKLHFFHVAKRIKVAAIDYHKKVVDVQISSSGR